MLFYFTGTGNSLYVAKQIEEEQISIPQACPEMAIQFGDIPMKEPNPNARYRNPNVTLTELVTANNQTEK